MPETNTMGKLQRKAHLFYIDATFGGETPSWFLVGKDGEELSPSYAGCRNESGGL